MVDVKIVIEGGVLPNANVAALTVSNSEKLRESFYRLFTQIVDASTFNLQIEMGAGEKSACKIFKQSVEKNKCCLLIDLDGKAEIRKERLAELEIEEFSKAVFFMVQKMEAWILSQPQAIIKAMQNHHTQKEENAILKDEIFTKNPESIVHPDDRLKVILSRYYFTIKRGVEKKKKYGKLKDAPGFIQYLSAHQLKNTFVDVRNLFEYLQLSNPSES